MKETLNKIKIYIRDAYYVIFRYPAETELKIQQYQREGTEAENTRLDQHYHSYAALKKYHKKIKVFLFSLLPITVLIIVAVGLTIVSMLNMFFSILGFKNNLFSWHAVLQSLMNFF
jgi:hypothetical protein